MKIIINILITSVFVFLLAHVLPGIHIDRFLTALIVAVVFGIINAFIKPVVKILTLPISILTLGLFGLVINALLVLLTSFFVKGFMVDGFLAALLFSIVLSILNAITRFFI